MAAAAPSPAAMGVAINRFLDLCRANPNGLQQGVVDESLKDLGLDVVTQAINSLLGKGHIQLFQQGGTLIYKEANRDEVARFKGLSSEDMLVYQAIQQSANSGIWTMDLKRRTNLQQPQVTKAIKNLETRNLIKAVKSVEHKSRKVYMLFELEPSRDVTGGAFYTEQEFDVEFISVLKHQCLHFILKQGLATLEQVADSVRKSGITKEELRLQDFKQIIDMLVLDGEIEEEISSGIGVHAAFPLVDFYDGYLKHSLEDIASRTQYAIRARSLAFRKLLRSQTSRVVFARFFTTARKMVSFHPRHVFITNSGCLSSHPQVVKLHDLWLHFAIDNWIEDGAVTETPVDGLYSPCPSSKHSLRACSGFMFE